MYVVKVLIYKGFCDLDGQWNGLIAGFPSLREYRYYHLKDTLTQKLGWVHRWVHDVIISKIAYSRLIFYFAIIGNISL